MTIGIDIDDTLTETSKLANSYLKNYNQYKDLEDYHLLKGKDLETFLKENIKEIQTNVVLKNGSKECLEFLKNMGCKLIIITARGKKGYEYTISITKEYFKKQGIKVDGIIYNKMVKGETCKKYNVDFFIDDKETVLDEVKTWGIKTLRFCDKSVKSNHVKVSTWQEVKDYIIKESEVTKNGKNY